MLEKDIQKGILEYLTYSRIFHWRNNSGAFKAEHGSFIRFGALGSPDIFAVKDTKVYGIEVKTNKGKQSTHQIEFEHAFRNAGGIYIVARSIDDLKPHL